VDGDAARARAREAAALADEVRAVATWTRRSADADWESVAAEAFRSELQAEVDAVLAAAGAVDAAAAALLAHALAVDAIASAAADAAGVVGGIVRRLLP